MNKLFKSVVCVLTVFSMVFIMGCVDEDESDTATLNGDWDRGDIVVTFINGDGVFTVINSNSGWERVRENGDIKVGDKKFRNIKKSGDLKWTGEERNYNTATYRAGDWKNCTITMDADGQNIRVDDHGPDVTNPTTYYTKLSY